MLLKKICFGIEHVQILGNRSEHDQCMATEAGAQALKVGPRGRPLPRTSRQNSRSRGIVPDTSFFWPAGSGTIELYRDAPALGMYSGACARLGQQPWDATPHHHRTLERQLFVVLIVREFNIHKTSFALVIVCLFRLTLSKQLQTHSNNCKIYNMTDNVLKQSTNFLRPSLPAAGATASSLGATWAHGLQGLENPMDSPRAPGATLQKISPMGTNLQKHRKNMF